MEWPLSVDRVNCLSNGFSTRVEREGERAGGGDFLSRRAAVQSEMPGDHSAFELYAFQSVRRDFLNKIRETSVRDCHSRAKKIDFLFIRYIGKKRLVC